MLNDSKYRKVLAYKWCKEYGDPEHHKCHHKNGSHVEKWSIWCANCNDGLSYIQDIVAEIKARF